MATKVRLLEINQAVKLFEHYVNFRITKVKGLAPANKGVYLVCTVDPSDKQEYKYQLHLSKAQGTFLDIDLEDGLWDIIEVNKEFKIVGVKLLDQRKQKTKDQPNQQQKEESKGSKEPQQQEEKVGDIQPPDVVNKNLKELTEMHFPEPQQETSSKKEEGDDMFKLVNKQLATQKKQSSKKSNKRK